VQMWLKRLFGKGEKVSPSADAPSTKETEQGREDRQKEFMEEQVRYRDEDESHNARQGSLRPRHLVEGSCRPSSWTWVVALGQWKPRRRVRHRRRPIAGVMLAPRCESRFGG
jgi:hypothetical protein